MNRHILMHQLSLTGKKHFTHFSSIFNIAIDCKVPTQSTGLYSKQTNKQTSQQI